MKTQLTNKSDLVTSNEELLVTTLRKTSDPGKSEYFKNMKNFLGFNSNSSNRFSQKPSGVGELFSYYHNREGTKSDSVSSFSWPPPWPTKPPPPLKFEQNGISILYKRNVINRFLDNSINIASKLSNFKSKIKLDTV